MIETVFLLIVGLLILIMLYFALHSITKIIINSILGLLLLFIVNYTHLLGYFGFQNITITWLTVLICALGGIPGAILIIILHLLGAI
ncbi:MAG: pro-sigmaK processing inhibitor BofA family protein [Methanospirillaceae archaeon]|nr:pro-sigmaK processing inhibitor BofA family protein [Methanospirillaceae archaeon]